MIPENMYDATAYWAETARTGVEGVFGRPIGNLVEGVVFAFSGRNDLFQWYARMAERYTVGMEQDSEIEEYDKVGNRFIHHTTLAVVRRKPIAYKLIAVCGPGSTVLGRYWMRIDEGLPIAVMCNLSQLRVDFRNENGFSYVGTYGGARMYENGTCDCGEEPLLGVFQ